MLRFSTCAMASYFWLRCFTSSRSGGRARRDMVIVNAAITPIAATTVTAFARNNP
jgi:hypothetical protein